jgi:ABC-type Fe2+-enterobactin transport system substrate-binding protein
MENEKKSDRSNVHYIQQSKPPKRFVSRTRLVMGLLLTVAVPIFVSLANKAVQENADAIRQVLGR